MADQWVLIVDDNHNIRESLSLCLTNEGYRTVLAKTGEEALKCLEEVPEIELVLLDITLPGMSGYDTIKAITPLKKHRTLKVCFISGNKEMDDVHEAIRLGGDDYLVKPVQMDQFLDKVQDLIGK